MIDKPGLERLVSIVDAMIEAAFTYAEAPVQQLSEIEDDGKGL